MTDDDKTLAEQKARLEGRDVQLQVDDTAVRTFTPPTSPDDEDDDATDDGCGALGWFDGKHRTCRKPVDHDGKHKSGRYTWRRRSGDRR